jgi:hypothetical protein
MGPEEEKAVPDEQQAILQKAREEALAVVREALAALEKARAALEPLLQEAGPGGRTQGCTAGGWGVQRRGAPV